MCRKIATKAKILRGLHDPFAEVQLPQTIHLHAGTEWIALTHDPLRQAESIFRLIHWHGRQNGGSVTADFFLRSFITAAIVNERFARLSIGHHHHTGQLVFERIRLRRELGHFCSELHDLRMSCQHRFKQFFPLLRTALIR